ncbi:MAG: diguanylate cyclase [Candidatus Omnitrophota bacterium]
MSKKGNIPIILAIIIIWAALLLIVIVPFMFKGARWILVNMNLQFGLESIAVFNLIVYLAVILLIIVIIAGMLGFISAVRSRKKINKLEELYRQSQKAIEKQSQDLTLIRDVGESLTSVLNKSKLIRLILENVIKFAKTTPEPLQGFILVYQYETGEFVYEAGFDMDTTMLIRTRFNPADEYISQVVRTKQLLVVEDVLSKEIFLRKDKISFPEKGKEKVSLFIIPLIVENNVVGIVNLFCPSSAAALLNNQSLLFMTLIKEASIALGSAVQSELAIIDRLTRFYNQGYFLRFLKQEIERCNRYKLNLTLLMIDIDHFKAVNDTYGHQQGDITLATVAKIIKGTSRVVDFCARYGGEEFAVILPETNLYNTALSAEELKQVPVEKMGEAITKAERLRETIEQSEIPGYKEGTKINITISIGIGVRRWTDEDIGPMELIKKADEQLYRAKESGRNKVCYPVELLGKQ